MQGHLEEKGWKVHLLPFAVSSRGQTYTTQHHGNNETLSHKNTSISEVHEEP